MDKMPEKNVSNSVQLNECKKLATNSLQILAKRRSCRSFTGEQITRQEIETLIMAGRTAPIGMNRVDDIQILVIQKKSILKELEENTLSYFEKNHIVNGAIYGAPTLIMIAVKKFTGAYEKGQYCSAACILENMILAATEMEIGNIYLSGVTSALNHNRELMDKVGIQTGCEAASAIAVGRTETIFPERDLLEERIVVKWCI